MILCLTLSTIILLILSFTYNLPTHLPFVHFTKTRDLTHWHGSAVDLVCIPSKVSQCLYGSLEVHKQGGQKRLPTVQ